MERRNWKLRRFLIVTMLCVTAVTTASSQEAPKIDLNALAARGEAIASEDPLAVELRDQQPDDSARRGFDIGMAAAEGQTLAGPGKQKLLASLPSDQQNGFALAVSFSLERNRNAKLAATGAKIAQANPTVAAARNMSPNNVRLQRKSDIVFYRLGFDIATGIFGDAAQGAQGNTALGPGSLKIRDSLSPAGQMGFNASVKFHLGQDAPPPAPEPRQKASGQVTAIDTFGKRDTARDNVYADALKNSPDSNEIRCRGYAGRGGSEYVFYTINSRPSPTGETLVTFEIGFTPSVKAAGARGEGLQPGECAFADRPISERGPYRIRFETVANAQLRQQLHGTPLDTSPTAAERFPDTQTIPAYLKDPNHYWSFFGATVANNFFVATGHKYWKPPVVSDNPLRRKTPQ